MHLYVTKRINIAIVFISLILLSKSIAISQVASKAIKVNQIGYITHCEKLAIVSIGTNKYSKFYIKSTDLKTTFYEDVLVDSLKWSSSGETVKKAYFTSFNLPGKYVIDIPNLGYSYPFEIKSNLYSKVNYDALRYYYLNRTSTAIPQNYGGLYSRGLGHHDTAVVIHASAASAARPAGTKISAPKGWYDAGDFGNYTVNSGISTYTLLLSYDLNKNYYDTLKLTIPEGSNNVPDILDEIKWNLDWMLSMQDPNDGGVYFKKVSLNFASFILPEYDYDTRYMINKTTTSALDFAAVMSYAYRVYQPYDTLYARKCLNAAKYAYEWAVANPRIYAQNPPNDNSGGYGDNNVTDEFYWAKMELYISTKDDSFFPKFLTSYRLAGWPNVEILGLYSLEINKASLTQKGLDSLSKAETYILNVAANAQLGYINSPYKVVPFGFYWGSNSVLLNTLLNHYIAYKINKNNAYLNAIAHSFDYLLGKNGPCISYVTGYGTNSPLSPHHRISISLGKIIPGMLVGGANPGNISDCGGASGYPSTLAAMAYIDDICSYSTNETAINWNAPMVAVITALLKEYACSTTNEPFQTFTQFEAVQNDCDVSISFSSSNETRVSNYSIEKSIDGKKYNSIYKIQNAQDSTYNFTDSNIGFNKVYYKVISKSSLGTAQIYNTTDIKTLNFDNKSLELYPTITHDIVTIDLACYTSTSYVLQTDLGRKLQEGVLSNTKNQLSLALYPPGSYIITFNLKGKEYKKRIVKI